MLPEAKSRGRKDEKKKTEEEGKNIRYENPQLWQLLITLAPSAGKFTM